MYKIFDVEDRVRVPPEKFILEPEEAIKKSLQEKWEGIVEREVGIVLGITEIKNMGEGIIIPGDGAIYYPVDFKLLSYLPEQHELVKGEVIDVTEFGAFVNIGPIDGMVHMSQLLDDFVSYDMKNSTFSGKKTKRVIKEGDLVKARIISISLAKTDYKIGLTMRQPGLGGLDWKEEEDKPRKKEPEKKEEKKKK
ncbi:MAG: DNA-directed RNA polymerase [Candidatus Aenigmarchaeota archaeon]|nr:DNA-directed RNA polymerase [Candidatus Aenigmarchaeota archaeon]